jgi:hypothetical protein
VPSGTGLQSLRALRQARQRCDPASESVIERPSKLAVVQERRAIGQGALEGSARDVVARYDIVLGDGARRVERDTSDIGPTAAVHRDLVSIFGTGLESPQAGSGGVRGDCTVDRQDYREQPALPRVPTTDDREDAGSHPTEETAADEAMTLVVADSFRAKLSQRHEAVL